MKTAPMLGQSTLGNTRKSGLFLGRRNVLGRRRRSFTKEVLLHLLHDNFLIFPACRIQAIFIEQHLAELDPRVPRLLGNAVINFLTQIVVERRLFESGKILLELYAKNLVLCHRERRNYLITTLLA